MDENERVILDAIKNIDQANTKPGDINTRVKGFCTSQKQFEELLFSLDKWCATYSLQICGDPITELSVNLKKHITKESARIRHMPMDTTIPRTPQKDFDKIGMVDSPKDWNRETIFYVLVKAEIRCVDDYDELSEFQKNVLHYYPKTCFIYVHRVKVSEAVLAKERKEIEEKLKKDNERVQNLIKAKEIQKRKKEMKNLTGISFKEMMDSLEEEKAQFMKPVTKKKWMNEREKERAAERAEVEAILEAKKKREEMPSVMIVHPEGEIHEERIKQ